MDIVLKKSNSEIFKKAMEFKTEGDSKASQALLEILLDTSYHDDASYELAILYGQSGYYDLVRQVLKKVKEKDDLRYLIRQAYLERIEMNWDRAFKLYELMIQKEGPSTEILSQLIRLLKSKGDISTAQNLAEALFLFSNQERFLKELCSIALEQQDRSKLKTLLKDQDKYSDKMFYFNLKKISQNKKYKVRSLDPYSLKRYYASSNKSLYDHLEKHIEGRSEDYFFKYLNLPKLVEEVTHLITRTNPVFENECYWYSLRLTSTVGVVNKEPTKDLRVVTFSGNDNIVTMFPVRYSSELNQEGYLENKEILLKRKGRVK